MTPQVNVRARLRTWSAPLFPAVAALFFCCASFSVRAQTVPAVITNAADVLALSPTQASNKIPVRVRGVVTAAEPGWRGQFIVQDETGGIFVESKSEAQPEPGDVVEVEGLTQPGAFAPIISKPTWTIVGTAPLPKAKRVSFEQLMSGLEDQQRVEIVGQVRAVTPRMGSTALDYEIASGGYRMHVFGKRPADVDPQIFVGARVRVRGTITASFNAKLRHLMSVVMFVTQTNDFMVEQKEAADPFEKPIIPLSGTAEYRRDIQPGQRVHVQGVVTLQRRGEDFFLEDSTGGLHVQSHQLDTLSVGDVVDAVGFPEFDHQMPVLSDALFRKTTEKRWPAAPNVVSIGQITNGLHHADLITIQAQLLERTIRLSQTTAGMASVELLLRADYGIVFSAEAEINEADERLSSIPIGSTIEVTGVCFTQIGDDKIVNSIRVFLPDSTSVRILRKPSWFTPQRLLIGVGILFVVLVGAVRWSVTVSKKNSVLSELIRDREKAQLELQQAHDQLEERVKERTAQLKFQITARKESELQFKATLQERTRLAQELHDTVEQTLTGIALQLDTTSKLFEARPENASHHLEMARSLVSQSQVDVRRSVWDLRSRALEQFDLPGALLTSGKQLTDGANMRFEVFAKGRVRPLSETVEENLLRVAQEAVTNVIKHCEATTVTIELDYGAQNIVLEVKDNGHGFEQQNSAGPKEGHFGLLGMSERAKRLGGELAVTSEPGKGTTVRIQVPIEQNTPAPDFAPSEAVL